MTKSTLNQVLRLAAAVLVPLGLAGANNIDTELLELQHAWARANYEVPDQNREKAFEQLEKEAAALVEANPDSAEALIWEGIVLSSYAGAKGGLGALGLAKRSRQDLERALEIDETALDGSAHTSLGVLYYKVPGWPFGFGSDDKAREHLQRALAINPEGIDPNYFYGEFLFEEHKYAAAAEHLERALKAADRPNRPLADQGRRKEVRALLAQVRKKLDNQH